MASASAVDDSCSLEPELDDDSSSLRGRGMKILWSILSWHLLWSELKVASLYVMGSLGHSTQVDAVDVVEQALQEELLLDRLSESLDIGDDS